MCLIPVSGVFELKLFKVAFDKLVISPIALVQGAAWCARSSKKTLIFLNLLKISKFYLSVLFTLGILLFQSMSPLTNVLRKFGA